jgi:hypothetical protein
MTGVKGKETDAWYSAKAHRHSGNRQAVMLPGGLPLRTGRAGPGFVHDPAVSTSQPGTGSAAERVTGQTTSRARAPGRLRPP